MKHINILLSLLILLSCHVSFASENVFYTLRFKSSDRMSPATHTLASLKNNYRKIDILIPQAYSIDASGNIKHDIEPSIFQFAQSHAMHVMPLVTNQQFDHLITHQFLINSKAQQKAIHQLIALCKQHNFYGVQIDFEMIPLKDRDNLTNFFVSIANQFHQHQLPISFAIAPIVTDQPTTLYLKRLYENWEGAYDLKKIGEVADFVSIMAYNQHADSTTPGPSASFPWVEAAVKYALQFIASNKISIGIPDYTTYWYTGARKTNGHLSIRERVAAISYDVAASIVKKNKATLIWDQQEGVHYALFNKNWLNEFLFIEDSQSFAEKYQLVKKYQLRGISVFDLGTEDERIWQQLISSTK